MDYPDLCWLAGLLEGEGCFDVKPQTVGNPAARIRLNMTDEDVVARVAALFDRKMGRTAGRQDGWKAVYSVQIQGRPALEMMRLLRPHMGRRRGEKIDSILAQLEPDVGAVQ